MKIKARVQKWGNGLGLRISGPMRDIPQFQNNTELEIDIDEFGFVARKIAPATEGLPFSEAELLDDLTAASAHADLLAKPQPGEF